MKFIERNIQSDLACEARELYPSVNGVTQEQEELGEITITRIAITTPEASKKLGKDQGNYITLEAPSLLLRPLDLFKNMTLAVKEELKKLIGNISEDAVVLVTGLGNREITPDSLGPSVTDKLLVTRHIMQYMPEAVEHKLRSLCAISPGVLGVTGIETVEIIRGAVSHVKPDILIAVDSLAARRSERISTTVQISDTGISPGSGVGNTRSGISSNELGCRVIAIGVPLVVYAATVVQDVIEMMADETGLHNDEKKLQDLAEKVITENMGPMIMTPKDIDVMVNDMSGIVADAINMTVHDAHYDEVRALIS